MESDDEREPTDQWPGHFPLGYNQESVGAAATGPGDPDLNPFSRESAVDSTLGPEVWVDQGNSAWRLGGFSSEAVGRMGDPVGRLLFGALGGAVAGEQGLVGL